MTNNRKAFTLIEFLIALVIIGFIVAMLVSFMSNPLAEATVKKSASKITDDTRMLSDAMQKYYMDNGNEMAAADDGESPTGLTAGASPSMTGIPVAPPSAVTDGTSTYLYIAKTDGNVTGYTAWGTVAQDAVIILKNVDTPICEKINENAGITANAGLGGPDAVDGTKDIQCVAVTGTGVFGDATAMNIVVKPIHIH